MKFKKTLYSIPVLAILLGMYACSNDKTYNGYVEAEFVHVATSISGNLINLAVKKGAWVSPTALLFILESDNERYAKLEALEELKAAESHYTDLTKGRRPDEIKKLEADREETKDLLELSEIEFRRQEKLLNVQGTSQEDYDRAKTNYESNKQKLLGIEADLRLAHLGAREDQINEAKETAQAKKAALKQAEWRLGQKTVYSPVKAKVQDTLFRVGEFVQAGMPVVTLLPPENLKARFYIGETELAKIKIGQIVEIDCDSCRETTNAIVNFISEQAEYTPPVIFSRESRKKLVYLVEARIPPEKLTDFHPGQPIDIRIVSPLVSSKQ